MKCDTKGCANEATDKVPDEKLPHVVYDLCSSCATGMQAIQGVELIDTPSPIAFEWRDSKPLPQSVGLPCGEDQ